MLSTTQDSHAQQCVDNGIVWTQSWTSCEKRVNPIASYGTTHWIQFEFEQAESITNMHIWNANRQGESDMGAKDVNIHFSLDVTTWSYLGNHVFHKATVDNNYAGFSGPNLGGQFVKKIIFTILSTHGDGVCASLAEVKFDIDPNACYGTIDECGVCNGPGKTTWYQDLDGDGLGNRAIQIDACTVPSGYVENDDDDCDNGVLDWDDVGVIFSDRLCTDCHSANGAGDLDLTDYAGISQGGNKCGSNILTGSTLIDIITIDQYAGCGPQIGLPAMNERVNGDPISPAELALIQAWVNDGALEDCRCPNGALDSDNDGVCDAIDYCPGFDNALIGTACNDGIACTISDVIDEDCNCIGTASLDSDLDGVCDAVDLAMFDPCTADGTIDGIEPAEWQPSSANDCDNDGVNIESGDENDFNECIDDIGAIALAQCQCPGTIQFAGGSYLMSEGVNTVTTGAGLPNGAFTSAISNFDRYFLEFPYLEANEEICFVVGFYYADTRVVFDINGVGYTFFNELQDTTRLGQEFCIKTLTAGPQIVKIREDGIGNIFIDGS